MWQNKIKEEAESFALEFLLFVFVMQNYDNCTGLTESFFRHIFLHILFGWKGFVAEFVEYVYRM